MIEVSKMSEIAAWAIMPLRAEWSHDPAADNGNKMLSTVQTCAFTCLSRCGYDGEKVSCWFLRTTEVNAA